MRSSFISSFHLNKSYLLPAAAVVIIEAAIAIGEITLPDRFCLYFQIAAVTAWFFLKPKVNRKHQALIFLLLLLPNTILTIHAFYLLGNGRGFNIENLYHILSPGMFYEYFKMAPLKCITVIACAITAVLLPGTVAAIIKNSTSGGDKVQHYRKHLKKIAVASSIMAICCYIPFYETTEIFAGLLNTARATDISPEALAEHGIKSCDIDEQDIKAVAGKNLIFIILESTERSYLDREIFPGLLPELEKFARDSQDFSNVSMPARTNGTFSSIYAMLTGMTMTPEHIRKVWNPVYNRQIGGKLSSLPKILNKAGYCQHFFAGHSADFALMGSFFESQKFDRLWFGADQQKTGVFSLHDSEVFTQALQSFNTLASGQRPFNLTLLTFDAHSPSGFHKKGEPVYHGNKMLSGTLYDAMFASDHALGKFLRTVKAHPESGKCCIVIASDHLAHAESVSTPVLKKFPRRRMLFLINNSTVKKFNADIPAMTFDIAPTILSALGVTHNYRFPLGENLYAPTRPERLNNTREQLQALTGYVRAKSIASGRLPDKISVTATTCVRLLVGELTLTLSTMWPSSENIGINFLKIPENLSVEPTNFSVFERFNSFAESANSAPGYILFAKNCAELAGFYGLDSTSGYLLGIIFNGKKMLKQADSPEKLFFNADETAEILKK